MIVFLPTVTPSFATLFHLSPPPRPRPNTAPRKGDSYDSKVEFKTFYKDVVLLAFPVMTNGIVPRSAVVDLTAKLATDGKLDWDVPPGEWIVPGNSVRQFSRAGVDVDA